MTWGSGCWWCKFQTRAPRKEYVRWENEWILPSSAFCSGPAFHNLVDALSSQEGRLPYWGHWVPFPSHLKTPSPTCPVQSGCSVASDVHSELPVTGESIKLESLQIAWSTQRAKGGRRLWVEVYQEETQVRGVFWLNNRIFPKGRWVWWGLRLGIKRGVWLESKQPLGVEHSL